jgi:hypothetical protein
LGVSYLSQYQPTLQGLKPYHLTPKPSNRPASFFPFSYVGQVAKIMPSFSRSARVNFGAFPTTRSALANKNMHNFRDETAHEPFTTVARHVFLSAQDALDALKSHPLLMINMLLVHKE